MNVYDEMKNAIFAGLPKKWDFDRKSAFVYKILEPLREHMQAVNSEFFELDRIVSLFAPSDATLRIAFPTPAHREEFTSWLCDGGGEQHYFQIRDYNPDVENIVDSFDYHSPGCVYAQHADNAPGDLILALCEDETENKFQPCASDRERVYAGDHIAHTLEKTRVLLSKGEEKS